MAFLSYLKKKHLTTEPATATSSVCVLEFRYARTVVKDTLRQLFTVWNSLESVLRLHCFSPTRHLLAFKWRGWNHLFGLAERETMTCLAWSPKPLTPLAGSEHVHSGADGDFPARLSSLRVYDQQLWSDHPAFPYYYMWRKPCNNPLVKKMTSNKNEDTQQSHILSWYELMHHHYLGIFYPLRRATTLKKLSPCSPSPQAVTLLTDDCQDYLSMRK